LESADTGAPAGQELVAQAVAYVGFALAKPALFRLMFGARRLGQHPDLAEKGEAAYRVLSRRVAAESPEDVREARVLGCWSLVHGLALLFLDGKVGENKAVPDAEITRRVAEVMLGGR
jgi:hypothetical protein